MIPRNGHPNGEQSGPTPRSLLFFLSFIQRVFRDCLDKFLGYKKGLSRRDTRRCPQKGSIETKKNKEEEFDRELQRQLQKNKAGLLCDSLHSPFFLHPLSFSRFSNKRVVWKNFEDTRKLCHVEEREGVGREIPLKRRIRQKASRNSSIVVIRTIARILYDY